MNIWRDRLNRWLFPLARRFPLSPNTVTVVAFILNLVAAAMLAMSGGTLPEVLLALPVIAVAGLLDGLDGAIARAQNKQSRFGDFLDHFLDRVSDAALLAGWAHGVGVHPLLVTATVAMVLLAGYAGTQIEASFRVRSYEGAGRAEYLIGIGAMMIIGSLSAGTRHGTSIANVLCGALLLFVCLTILSRLKLARQLAARNDESE